MDEESPYLTVEQAAARLQTSHEMVRRMLRDGRLRGLRLGGRRAGWRIPASEISALFAADGRPRPGPVPARVRGRAVPGLAPLLDQAARCRAAGDTLGAARWQQRADELVAAERNGTR